MKKFSHIKKEISVHAALLLSNIALQVGMIALRLHARTFSYAVSVEVSMREELFLQQKDGPTSGDATKVSVQATEAGLLCTVEKNLSNYLKKAAVTPTFLHSNSSNMKH